MTTTTLLAISYSAQWQGVAAQRWDSPTTLAIDSLPGMACIVAVALMGPLSRGGPPPPGAAIPEGVT